MPRPAQELTWTVSETAALLKINAASVRRMISRGELPALRIGRRLLVAKTALTEWLEANKSATFAGRPTPEHVSEVAS